ncbi:MAG TPA: PP2C family serine/threonine-protein phosphatase [Ktedonobacteraceae bacterium]
MSTERFMSRICKSPGRFAFALLLGALLALPCLLPAAVFARASVRAGAHSLSSELNTATTVMNKVGVSVVRLSATYSGSGHVPTTCTGLGVLVASQMIAPQKYTNWVLTDGNLISSKMSVCGQLKGEDLTLNTLNIWASSEYADAKVVQLAKLNCLEVLTRVACGENGVPADPIDTNAAGYTLVTFQSSAGEPYLELAPAASSASVNIGLIKSAGGGPYPSKVVQGVAETDFLAPNVVSSPPGDTLGSSVTPSATALLSNKNIEGGTPELNDHGQLVGMWVNNGTGGYTPLPMGNGSSTWQTHNFPPLMPATSTQNCTVASCWLRGINEYNQGPGHYSAAHPYLQQAYILNQSFVAARTFSTLTNPSGTPNHPRIPGDQATGSASLMDLLNQYAIILLAAGALVVLIVLVVIVLVARARIHRRKLAVMENEWKVARQTAEQEVLQKKAQVMASAPPPPPQAAPRPAPYCPNCHNPVLVTDSVCPNCRFPLAPTASGLGVRLMGNAPAGSAPLPPLAPAAPLSPPPPPPPSISEQPTVLFQPGSSVPVGSEVGDTTGKRPYYPAYEEPTLQQVRGYNLSLAVGTRSDPGIKRKHKPNEDSMFAYRYDTPRQQFGLFVVADGMGGHANGQDASRLAIQTMINFMLPNLTSGEAKGDEALLRLMSDGVQSANQAVHGRNQEAHADMGTTMTAALIIGATAYVANVGDSRTYLYRQGQGLSKVTHDHSVVASLVDAGIIKPDDIYTHPKRNQIYRSLGEKPVVEVDTFQVNLLPGDKLLLCSDGLWDMVRDPLIQEVLGKTTKDPNRTGQDLIKAALDGGGEDNVSVIVVQFAEAKEGSTIMSGVQLLAKPETVNVPNIPVV